MQQQESQIRFFQDIIPAETMARVLEQYEQVACLTDSNTIKDCLPSLMPSFDHQIVHVISIPAGEEHKNLSSAQEIWHAMLRSKLGRNALMICLGGGVVTDLGGFVASTYQRGIDFLHMPTSLLGMVDAAIGGKTGCNFKGKKNYLGTFAEPLGVWIQPGFLGTLPPKELINGYAELIKHGLIADAGLFSEAANWLVTRDLSSLQPLIQSSVRVKTRIVGQDPLEKGERKLLNFGHSLGHAIESLYFEKGQTRAHGQAVAAGMVMEAYISMKTFGRNSAWLDQVNHNILPYFEPVLLEEDDKKKLTELLSFDKKRTAKGVGFTLLEEIGEGVIDQIVEPSLIEESIDFYMASVSTG
jgi:3-dehydroquinate synthase